jgi:hypothetical protein
MLCSGYRSVPRGAVRELGPARSLGQGEALLTPRDIRRAAAGAMGHQVIEDLANEATNLWDMRNSVKAFRQLIWLETLRLLELRIFRRWIVSQTEHAIAIGPRLKSTCSASSMRMPLITGIFLVGQRKTSGRMSRQCRHQSAVPQRHLTLRDERRTLDDAEARRNGRRSRHQSFQTSSVLLRGAFTGKPGKIEPGSVTVVRTAAWATLPDAV